MKRFRLTSSLSFALLLAAGCQAAPQDPSASVPGASVDSAVTGARAAEGNSRESYLGTERPSRMLSLVLVLTENGVVEKSRVEAPNTINRRNPDEKRDTFFRVLNARGETLFERGFRLETEIRSETNGSGGTITAQRAALARPEFVVSVPLFEGIDVIRFYRNGADGTRANPALLGEVRP